MSTSEPSSSLVAQGVPQNASDSPQGSPNASGGEGTPRSAALRPGQGQHLDQDADLPVLDAASWALIERYDHPLPRYTSYPTVPAWTDVGPRDVESAYARARRRAGDGPLSLYVHIPFCERMCLYCGCNVVVSKSYDAIGGYLESLLDELRLLRDALGPRPLVQLHFGGGTPTMLEPADFGRLLAAIRDAFEPLPEAEMSVEIDPVVTRREHLAVGREHGLNRLSVGVQDFSDEVQQTVQRLQSVADAERIFADARALGYESINIDLMYGLPTQTSENLRASAHRAVDMGADRLAIFGYAHVPWMKPHQRKLEAHGIPDRRQRWDMATAARAVLTERGMVPIGMDHFARPTDELALAAAEHRLWRNFQGYTLLQPVDLAAIGVTAIGDVGGTYLQNVKRVSDYRAIVAGGRLPAEKGATRSEDDDRRRTLINSILCNLYVDLDAPLYRDDDFSRELDALAPLCDDGLVALEGRRLTVTELGRVFVRNVASVFDTYLQAQQRSATARFSRSV